MSLARKIGALFSAGGSTVDAAYLPAVSGVPAGTMAPFTGDAAPSGWLLCFGQAVSRTTYAALFTAIGTTYGAGIGANAVITAITSASAITLSVNNTANGTGPIRFGVVDGATLGAAGGSHVHALGIEQIPAHAHTYTNLGDSGGSAYTPGGEQSANSTLTTSSTGGGQAHPNLPPTLVVNYVIKT